MNLGDSEETEGKAVWVAQPTDKTIRTGHGRNRTLVSGCCVPVHISSQLRTEEETAPLQRDVKLRRVRSEDTGAQTILCLKYEQSIVTRTIRS